MPCRAAVICSEPRNPRLTLRIPLHRTEHELISDRHRRVQFISQPLLASLSLWLRGNTSLAALTTVAECIADARGIRIDRMARRMKGAMICWLCENAPQLALGFGPTYFPQNRVPIPVDGANFRNLPPRPVAASVPAPLSHPPPPPPPPPPTPQLPPPADDDFYHFDQDETAEDDLRLWGNEN
jgi:hypothetical protein